MSNVIPMVSASPPPFDDHSFGYEDNDDFGNFTGADDSHESSPGPSEALPLEHELGNKSEKESSQDSKACVPKDKKNINENSNGLVSQDNFTKEPMVNGTDDFGDFADFEQENCVVEKKPHIEHLPIPQASETFSSVTEASESSTSKTSPRDVCLASDNDSLKSPVIDEKDTIPPSIKNSRDSTTDSGMFSTDISPVPKSEDTAEFCDKSDSDNDDTFPDLPKDRTESPGDFSPSDTEHTTRDQSETLGIESERRVSLGEEPSSLADDCVSDITKDDASRQSNVEKVLGDDVAPNDASSVDDQCSEHVEQLSEHVEQLSEAQGNKSSHDVSETNSSAQEFDEDDDWGDFDSVDPTEQQESTEPPERPESGQIETMSAFEAEDDCLEAVDEVLKDSKSLGVYDCDEPQELDLKPVCDVQSSDDEDDFKLESPVNVEGGSDCVDYSSPRDSLSPEDDSCNNDLEARTGEESDSKESFQDSVNETDKCESNDQTEEEISEWNAFADFSESEDKGADNWAEFKAPASDNQELADSNSQEDGDFGDFNSGADGLPAENESGDWADFEESTIPVATEVPVKQHVTSIAPIEHSKVHKEKLEQVMSSCFSTTSEDPSSKWMPSPNTLELVVSTQVHRTISMHISRPDSQKPKEPLVVWNCLQNLDKTHALLYQWSSGQANKQMFKTLRIDTQNILFGHKKQSVPIFASNIGLLEPIRGPVSAKPPQAKPTLVDPDKPEEPGVVQELPPVEFDWDNSGLTNPLAVNGTPPSSCDLAENAGPAISSNLSKTLDLDFLSVQETESVNKNTVFQSEILDAPRSSVKSLPPLEDVLRNMKVTSTTTKNRKDENLTEEASRVVDSLPLLSFMTSKVLMFPLKQ